MSGPSDAESVALRSAAAMQRADAAARSAAVRLVEVRPGAATVAMRVGERHVNGHGVCHGGYLFLLADSVMAYACNSHGISTVASRFRACRHRPDLRVFTASGHD